jgi:hypothetical protein
MHLPIYLQVHPMLGGCGGTMGGKKGGVRSPAGAESAMTVMRQAG